MGRGRSIHRTRVSIGDRGRDTRHRARRVDYGIRQSRHYQRYADWLHASLDLVAIALIDREVAQAYGAVRFGLKKAGTPIPINDTWIAALARHRQLPIVSRDGHCDAVAGIRRVSW